MTSERESASSAFVRWLMLGSADPRAAWDACPVPQRMVSALEVLADPRWMARAACVAWRVSVAPKEIEGVLSLIEAWAAGGELDVEHARAQLEVIEGAAGAPPNAITAATFAMRTLVDLAADPLDPARSLGPVAAVDMAIDLADEDRTAVDARITAAIREAIDPFEALAMEARTFEIVTDDDPIPF